MKEIDLIKEKNVIPPIDKKIIITELANCDLLERTRDNKEIYLTTINESPYILKEIARLREQTFRNVGEGTGKILDIDKYDSYYNHLIVWDKTDLEIAGAYRICNSNEVLHKKGVDGFYSASLFDLSNEFINNFLICSMEMGRSFVQQKYWNTNILFYLWRGIGIVLLKSTNIKYFFGPVSISNSYPDYLKSMIIYFYKKWYGSTNQLIKAKHPFLLSESDEERFKEMFYSFSYNEDFRTLKQNLKKNGYTIPILFKQYSELCYEGGVKFLDFNIDPDFENCVDGLVLVTIDLIKESKKEYFLRGIFKEPN